MLNRGWNITRLIFFSCQHRSSQLLKWSVNGYLWMLAPFSGLPLRYCHLSNERESESRLVVSDSFRPRVLYSPWNSPGQNSQVGSLSLLQGIFPTQGLNRGLPHCRWVLYQLSHKRSPRILEWVAYPFSSRSSRPWNRTGVSCIASRFFTNWAIKESLFTQ